MDSHQTKIPIRILYMEDDQTQARLFQRRLEAADYIVDVASDGEEGLAMYEPGLYNIIFVDQQMPIHDGIEVLRILSEREGSLPPIIMVTAAGNEKIAVEAMKLGASDYIVKDVTGGYLKLLPSVIQQTLRRQQLVEEKRQAETARNRLTAILEATTDFVCISNPQGTILYLNQAGRQMVGIDELEDISNRKIATCFAEWARLLVTGEAIDIAIEEGSWRGESALLTKEGQEIPVSQLVLAHQSPQGFVEFISTVARDISDQKLFEQTLLKTHEELEGRVQERTAELSQANRDLIEQITERKRVEQEQQKLIDELNAFAHTVAHDLKSPLSLIMGFAQLLEEDYTLLPEDELKKYLATMAQSARKMERIIDELLLLAGVRQAKGVEIEALDMGLIVSEAQFRLGNEIVNSQAQIIIPESWPVAFGYGPWIEEVWANYLSNAIKYGGQPPRVEVGATENGNGTVRFWIKDNGAGLSEDQQARLFTPFTKLDHTNSEGHGLGLSIVQRIINRLGGTVGVESDMIEGQGCIFSFTLPGGVDNRVA
ncbi:MAG: response regulator [Chloroflexota bacterium]